MNTKMLYVISITDVIVYPHENKTIHSLYREKLIDWWIQNVFIGHADRYFTSKIRVQLADSRNFFGAWAPDENFSVLPLNITPSGMKRFMMGIENDEFSIDIHGLAFDVHQEGWVKCITSSVRFSHEKEFLDPDMVDKYHRLLYSPDGSESIQAKRIFSELQVGPYLKEITGGDQHEK